MNLGPAWDGPASCLPDACFCEQIAVSGLKQAANTWSSLGFVLVGAWSAFAAPGKVPGLLRLACALCLVGVGFSSAYFHATLTFLGQWLDVSSMYAYASLLCCVHLGVLRALSARAQAVVCVLATGLSSLLAASVPSSRRIVFDLLLLFALGTLLRVAFTVWRAVPKRALMGAVTLLVVASASWTLDIRHLWCEPTSPWQGHALWHVLTALATACIFVYYRRGFAVARAQLDLPGHAKAAS